METTTLTIESLTPQEAALAGSIVGATMVTTTIFLLIWYVVTVIATWRIFKKAGEPGWKAIIPIYNYYIMFKIVGMSGWFWAELIVSIIASIIFSTQNVTTIVTETGAVVYDFGSQPLVPIALTVLLIFTVVVAIVNSIRTSRAFNHGGLFALGLFFFQPIFWLILGFGSSKYNKKKALQK